MDKAETRKVCFYCFKLLLFLLLIFSFIKFCTFVTVPLWHKEVYSVSVGVWRGQRLRRQHWWGQYLRQPHLPTSRIHAVQVRSLHTRQLAVWRCYWLSRWWGRASYLLRPLHPHLRPHLLQVQQQQVNISVSKYLNIKEILSVLNDACSMDRF